MSRETTASLSASAVEPLLRASLERLDQAAMRRDYQEADELVFRARCLDDELVQRLATEYEAVRSFVHRRSVPGIRTAGAVGQTQLRARAPFVMGLYRSPSFVAFLSELAGKRLLPKSVMDENACALYVYDRAGDGMRLHYDRCSARGGSAYTALVGLVDRSTMQLRCELFHGDSTRPTRRLDLSTPAGSMAFFCGSKLYHGTTLLRAGQERVMLSLSYESEHTLGRYEHFREELRDAFVYFGLSGLLTRLRAWR